MAAAAAASARAAAFLISRFPDLSIKPHHLLLRPTLPSSSSSITATNRRRASPVVVSCLVSSGGGVSDDFISTTKSGFLDREFNVIAAMLQRIELLDNSVISKGVSDSAKDSMKQTISTMLGLLPSDQFSVTVRVSKRPLDLLLMSSVITGYTLWNAEYRVSLMRNFDISTSNWRSTNFLEGNEISEVKREENEGGGASDVKVDNYGEDLQIVDIESLGDLSPQALNYIQQLESELSTAKKELNARKQENMQMECLRGSNNDLLEYLRSLEADMVIELSRPSSSEVEEIIHQLVGNVLSKFFKDDSTSDFMGDSTIRSTNLGSDGDESCDTIGTSRDYLAKLLFWCMLLGHHLRGLENRLHLSCAVALL